MLKLSAFFLLVFCQLARGNFTAPQNVVSDTRSQAVFLTWDDVPGAAGYQITLTNVSDGEQIQQTNSKSPEAAFAGLRPSTSYSASIRASDLNVTLGAETVHPFTTRIARVKDVKVVEATSGTIEISWEPTPGAVRYEARMTTDDDKPFVPEEMAQFENTMFITGLESMVYYKIFIRAVAADGSHSDETETRTRTGGSGFRLIAWWEYPDGGLRGGGMIMRPLAIPVGLYRMRIQFPCPVVNHTFWNAYVNDTASRPEDGFFLIYQNVTWMWLKTEIGVIFDYGVAALECESIGENVTVDFGDDIAPKMEINCEEIPLERDEWTTTVNRVAPYAGRISIMMDEMYHGTNINDKVGENSSRKPEPGGYVIELSGGEGCQGGLIISNVWGMIRKDTTFIQGIARNVVYFSQNKDFWSVNTPGLLYGYDPANCPTRKDVSARICFKSTFVNSIYSSPNYGEQPPDY